MMVKSNSFGRYWVILLSLLLASLSACQPPTATPPAAIATAYAQATQISVEYEATGVVLAARATNEARLQQITGATPTLTLRPPVGERAPLGGATPLRATDAPAAVQPTARLTEEGAIRPETLPSPVASLTPESGSTPTEVLGVGFSADRVLIVVTFKASPRVAQSWFQGSFSVTDEASGKVYEQVSVAPIIGPLINRPRIEGHAGYVMLVNTDTTLKGGELVTVRLGNTTFAHIQVKMPS